MSVLAKIREKINSNQFRITHHAYNELAADSFTVQDLKRAARTGYIRFKFYNDPRGIRYAVNGFALDGRELEFISRFDSTGYLVIITVYEP